MIPSSPVMRLPLCWPMSRGLHRYSSSRTVSQAIAPFQMSRSWYSWGPHLGICRTEIQQQSVNTQLPSEPSCPEWHVQSKMQRDSKHFAGQPAQQGMTVPVSSK